MAQKLQASSSFIDEKKLEDYLMRTFHYSSFKSDEQKEAIMKILEREFISMLFVFIFINMHVLKGNLM